MIRVERYQVDEHGQTIAPDAKWFTKAEEATSELTALGGEQSFAFDRNVYAAEVVRAALSRIFCNKCGYCEYPLTRTDLNVEHYRPKARVAESPQHHGYYWLAYEWTNLLAACTFCNQLRREPPEWEVAAGSRASGKADSFPLVDETKRAQSPADDISREEPLLVNPTTHEPSDHITFDPLGFAVAKTKEGQCSIEVYNLNARALNKDRQRVIERVTNLLRQKESAPPAPKSPTPGAFLDYVEDQIRSESDDAAHYAGAARAVLANPQAFGV